MNKFFPLIIVFIAVLGVSLPALADQPADIDGDKLQQRANELLQAEPEAEQVKVRVEVEPKVKDGKRTINFSEFDANEDGTLSRDEIGEKLFKVFDGDGNQVIDNLEMKRPRVIAFTPMERTTIEIVDYHKKSKPTKKTVSHQEFLQESKLSRFDKDADGLSPLDFLEMPFNRVNVKDDAVIDMYEWKLAYAESIRPKHMEAYNYND